MWVVFFSRPVRSAIPGRALFFISSVPPPYTAQRPQCPPPSRRKALPASCGTSLRCRSRGSPSSTRRRQSRCTSLQRSSGSNPRFLAAPLIPSSQPSFQCSELYLDKRYTNRYYVSVSQQNIGYKPAKRRFPMGVWFFVVCSSSVRLL